MQKIVKKLRIEGSYFDCLLYKKYLYLWNIEGEQRVYNWEELFVRRNESDPKDVSREEMESYLLKVTDVPGRSLPIDTNLMDGKLYVATESGLYRSDAYNTYENRRRERSKAEKIWDARLFSINRHPESPLLAMAAGDDGLYEMNMSAYTTCNLIEAEKNIFCVGLQPSHQADYFDSSIASGSRGDQYVARFVQNRIGKGKSVRNFVGIEPVYGNNTLGSLVVQEHEYDEQEDYVRHSRWRDYEIVELEEGLHIIKNGVLLLALDAPIIKWRIYLQKGQLLIIVLTEDDVEVFNSVEATEDEKEQSAEEDVVRYAKSIIHRISQKYPENITNINVATQYLKEYLTRLQGAANIDFIDASDWDRMTRVEMDFANQVIYIIKEWPRRFKDKGEEMMHRMAWGVDDCFVAAFKFGELSIFKDFIYPFVSLRGKRISTSRQRFLLHGKYGKIKQVFHHPFCNEYRIQGDAFVYNVCFYHTDAVCALMLGKDSGWGSTDSTRILSLLTMDSCRKRLYESMKRMSGQMLQKASNPEKFENSPYVRKILNSLKRCITEMMRLELECRKRDTYDYDDNEGNDFGELERKEILYQLADVVDENRYGMIMKLCDLVDDIDMREIRFPQRVEDLCRLAEEYRIVLEKDLSQGRYISKE